MSDSSKAVFLSYASQDAEAAKRIADALRGAGVEVWFDAEGGLEHGDEWDAKIRRQIKECVLFIPIVSANTEAREEGYFRIEWELAAQRALGIATGVAFILPVVIDGTREQAALVPDRFRAVQWTKLPEGVVPAEVLQRFLKLWSHRTGAIKHGKERSAGSTGPDRQALVKDSSGSGWKIYAGLAVACLALAAGAVAWLSRKKPTPPMAAAVTASVAAPVSESRQLVARARALIDDDLMAGRENFRLADEFSRRAVALDATDGEAWATAARVSSLILAAKYEMTPERRETAKTQVERAGRLAPDSIETGLALATYLEVNNDPREAERLLRRLVRQAPGDKRLWLSLAANVENDGRNEEALATLRQAPGLLEEDPQAQSLLAHVLSRQGRYREEEAVLDRVLQRSPTKLAYYYQLVLLGFYRSDLPAASRLLERIPPQLMQEDSMMNSAAEIWLRLGEGEKALQVLQKSPRDFLEEGFEVRPKGFLTGAAQQLLGRPIAAAAEWRQALVVVENRLAGNPNQPLLLYWKGVLQALTGQKAAALETRKLYRELEAKPDAWFDAILLVAAGENEQAIQGLEQAWPAASISTRSEIRNELLYGPWLTAIRADPRMQRLIAEQTAAIERDRVGPAAVSAKAEDRSVAVLAFANLSDDKANEYFSDGISEELLNVLAKVPGLKVTARTSAFYFKGRDTPVPEIARQLGVAYVVEGSVRKAGDKVRITAQLIKAADGFHVWSDTFTRDLKDIFAVQDEIAGLVAKNLSLKLGTGPGAGARVDPRAFELYVRARQIWSSRSLEDFALAEQLLNQALEIDPGFVRGRAALIDVRQMRGFRQSRIGYFEQRNAPELDRYLEQVREVLAIDPGLAEAYATMGTTLQGKWLWPEARQAYLRAVELNPNYATGHQWLGMQLAMDGRMDEALAELKVASELDPLSPIILDNYGWLLNSAGQPRGALAVLERALALNPGFSQTSVAKVCSLWALGRRTEAMELLRQIKFYDLDEQVRALIEVDLSAEVASLVAASPNSSDFARAKVLLAGNHLDEALIALGSGSGITYGDLLDLLYKPLFDPVRRDPRFLQLMATFNLAEAHARVQAWRKAHVQK